MGSRICRADRRNGRDLKRRPLAEHGLKALNCFLGYTVVKRCVLSREQFGSTTQEFESMTNCYDACVSFCTS